MNRRDLTASLTHPFPLTRVRPILVQKAKLLGITIYSNSPSGTLSDLIRSRFPDQWLDAIFPGILNKKSGELLPQLDGILFLSTCASSMAAYLLGICVLFDSVDAALSELRASQEIKSLTKRQRRKMIVDHDRLREDYIRTQGVYSEIASEHEQSYWAMSDVLMGMGLPNLTVKGGKSLVTAATNFFLRGFPLLESARDADVPPAALERVVRIAGAELSTALKLVAPVSTKTEAPLRKNQHPHLMGYTTSVKASLQRDRGN